jgi:hypothetical protein
MYADDLLLLSPSILGLQKMLDICYQYGITHNIPFNPSKTVSVAIGHTRGHDFSPVYVDKHPIPWVDYFNYLGVVFKACGALGVDTSFIKRKSYASLNSVLVGCSSTEHVKVQLINRY